MFLKALGVPVLIHAFAVWNVDLMGKASAAVLEKAVTSRVETMCYREIG